MAEWARILFQGGRMGSKFPPTETDTGHKLLPPFLRVIQGDGISLKSLKEILDNMIKHKWAADNLAFGAQSSPAPSLCSVPGPGAAG